MHFDSSGLKDYYFIDSQWLCDMFAHVVSSEFNSEYKATVFLYLLGNTILTAFTNVPD